MNHEMRLRIYLEGKLNRRVRIEEICDALGAGGRNTYYRWEKDRSDIRPDRLIIAATHFGIAPVEVLRDYGVLTATTDEPQGTVGDGYDLPTSDTPTDPGENTSQIS